MSWLAIAREAAKLAKQWPAGITVLAIAVILALLGYFHFAAHAKADELATVKKDVAELKETVESIQETSRAGRLEGLEAQMFQTRVDNCRAESPELKQIYAARLADLEIKYIRAGGNRYRLPECEDL